MQNFVPGTLVSLTFPLRDEAENSIQPTAVRWRLVDENQVDVIAWSNLALPTPGQDEFSISIPGASNELAPDTVRGLRIVEVEVTDARGTIPLSQTYLLAPSTALVVGKTSWITKGQAVLISQMLPRLDGWLSASEEAREVALVEAFRRLQRMPVYADRRAAQNTLYATAGHFETGLLLDMIPESFVNTDPRFQDAVRRAQVLEADHILTVDPIAQMRESGVISMTVGESSNFFRAQRAMDRGLCKRAYQEVAPWLRDRVTIGRG
jgi:hypothetical protein